MKFTLVIAAALALAAGAASAQPGAGGVRAACLSDYLKLCQGVQPGGGRGFQCLKQHNDQLSAACRSALAAAIAAHQGAAKGSGNTQ